MHSVEYQLPHGSIAGLSNAKQNKPIMLLVHGWLDNAASFTPLLPYLDDFHAIAIDWPGHGLSSHRGADSQYNLIDYVQDLAALIEQQKWQNIVLVGHSLGGIVASIYTSAFPDNISHLICIETAGPLTEAENTTQLQITESIISRIAVQNKTIKQPESLAAVVKARCAVSDMQPDHARLIMRRNLFIDEQGNNVRWQTDPKLRTKSSLRLTEAQTENIIRNIKSPTLIVLGNAGFDKVRRNLSNRQSWFANLQTQTLTGGHHVHMQQPHALSEIIKQFADN